MPAMMAARRKDGARVNMGGLFQEAAKRRDRHLISLEGRGGMNDELQC